MAEFDFLATWEDSWRILAAILAVREYSLVPDLHYDKPEPLFVTTLDDPVKEMLQERRNGFIWSAKFSVFPPTMKRTEGGEAAGGYYVSLSEGGPYLRLVLPVCYEEGRIMNLGPGSLYYPKWTINPRTNAIVKPSPELRMGFKAVKAIIKKHLVRLKERPDIWGGQEASRLLDEHRARIRGFERPGDSG
jgi:hypothetical protein